MESLLALLPTALSQLGLAYLGYKSLPLLIQLALIVCPSLILIVYMWTAVRRPWVALGFIPLFIGAGILLWHVYPVPCPAPFTGNAAVSSGWVSRGWSTHWTDRALPKPFRSYQARVRVRVGKNDLYVIFVPDRVHVVGKDVDIRAVEPLAGQVR